MKLKHYAASLAAAACISSLFIVVWDKHASSTSVPAAQEPSTLQSAAKLHVPVESMRAPVELPQEPSERDTNTVQPEASKVVSSLLLGTPADWAAQYADATQGQLHDERRALELAIHEASSEYFANAWATGNYKTATATRSAKGLTVGVEDSEDNITQMHINNEAGTVDTAILPSDQYPDVYDMRRKAMWLLDRETELRLAPLSDKKAPK